MFARVSVLFCLFMHTSSLKLDPEFQPGFPALEYKRQLGKSAMEDLSEAPKCHVPENFKRDVNLHAIRQPTEAERSHAGFHNEPTIEKIYYVNLDGSVKRRLHMEKMLGLLHVKYERWKATTKEDAVNITANRIHEFSECGLGNLKEQPQKGTQAVYYSHHQLLQRISQHKDPNAVFIVLEDDITFKPDTMQELHCQIKMLPSDWDVFKFGYVGYTYPWVQQRSNRPPSTEPWKYPNCPDFGHGVNEYTCYQADWNWNYMGNQGYAVRPQGAARLIEHLRKRPIMDFDGAIMPLNQETENFDCATSDKKSGSSQWVNTYVSKQNLLEHHGYKSDRFMSFAKTMQMFLGPIAKNTHERDNYPDDQADSLKINLKTMGSLLQIATQSQQRKIQHQRQSILHMAATNQF